jgi:uncharacterized protein YggE
MKVLLGRDDGRDDMKKLAGILAIAATALLAFACTETTVVPSDSQVASGISVSGTGSVFGEPDIAVLSLGVEAEADSVAEARAEAAEAMDAIMSSLRDGGVEEEDIQTSRFSVYPRYDFRENEQVLLGFTVENTVIVKIRNIDDTGTLLDASIEAGGDLTRVDDLRFTIDDPTALKDEARRMAMQDARSRAETLAEAGGVSLGDPRSISESGGPQPIPFDEARFAGAEVAADLADTPISLGELEVQISVQVQYEID